MNKYEHYIIYGGKMPGLDLPTVRLPINANPDKGFIKLTRIPVKHVPTASKIKVAR